MDYLEIEENDLYLCFWLKKGAEGKLIAVGTQKKDFEMEAWDGNTSSRIVEILTPGARNYSFRGTKNFYDIPQVTLRYVEHSWIINGYGKQLTISQRGDGFLVHTRYQFYKDIPVFSCESEVINESAEPIWIDGVTSFCYGDVARHKEGTVDPGHDLELWYARNTWSAECRWEHHTLQECGVIPYGNLCYDRFVVSNSSGLSSGEFLPEVAVYNRKKKETLLWQIEHNGAWAWEMGCTIPNYSNSFLEENYRQQVYVQLSGPRMEEAHWSKKLIPGQSFCTVPVTVAVGKGQPDTVFQWLTQYRRRKKCVKQLPVIFNDYMNCLMGSSTTASLLPYIHKAKEAGCEVFVVDCGWYDSGNWQYTFGTFVECLDRYPNSLKEVTDCIRSSGMIPGLWLELEAFGVDHPEADELFADYMFCRNQRPVVDSGRYHLDFRHPKVRQHASAIVKRVVEEYGLGYLKIDYNLCSGWGTDYNSDSLGDGLLEHNRAYLDWLEQEQMKYPQVIWENCASGGLRMDYAMLSRMDIQSLSDQEDYRVMAFIASNCAAAVLPEQAGIWCYPRREGDERETEMNLVSALLFRIHMGGHLTELSADRFELVREGIACYKKIRQEIAAGIPYWPGGLNRFDSGWLCWGLHGQEADYIAICRREDENEYYDIPMRYDAKSAHILYPAQGEAQIIQTDPGFGKLRVRMPEPYMACLIELRQSAIE